MKNYIYIETIIGKIILEEEDGLLARVSSDCSTSSDTEENETPVLSETKKQMEEYFNKKRTTFDLPLKLDGTPFQNRVWNALIAIPYGETRTYKDIAEEVGSPKGYRAVGLANNKNRLMIVVPCHRVIGTSGKLVGFAGGLDMKDALLQLEKQSRK